jgi:hypothetical protein
MVKVHYMGEHTFLQGCNIGPAVRLLAHTEVECLLVRHDVLELLPCNEPLVGVRLFHSLAIALGKADRAVNAQPLRKLTISLHRIRD